MIPEVQEWKILVALHLRYLLALEKRPLLILTNSNSLSSCHHVSVFQNVYCHPSDHGWNRLGSPIASLPIDKYDLSRAAQPDDWGMYS